MTAAYSRHWIDNTSTSHYTGEGTKYLVETPAGVLYALFINHLSDLVYSKSTDGGKTWESPVVVFAGTVVNLSVWYDRWSNISAGLIHCAYTDSGIDDTLYRTIDTENSDALSTETTIFSGATTAIPGSAISICRARGGNVYCRTVIDAGAEGGFFRLTNANVPNGAWDAARTINETLATLDQAILLPGWAADNQDMMLVFWDVSANEISMQLYDDSADSWSETSISGSMVENNPSNGYPNFAAVVDIANSRNILVAWNAADTANQDLLGWTLTESAVTAFTTPPVLNAVDDCTCCALSIDSNGYLYVAFFGNPDGSETYLNSLNLYMKVSRDYGETWDDLVPLTTIACALRWMAFSPVMVKHFCLMHTVTGVGGSGAMNMFSLVRSRQPKAHNIIIG